MFDSTKIAILGVCGIVILINIFVCFYEYIIWNKGINPSNGYKWRLVDIKDNGTRKYTDELNTKTIYIFCSADGHKSPLFDYLLSYCFLGIAVIIANA